MLMVGRFAIIEETNWLRNGHVYTADQVGYPVTMDHVKQIATRQTNVAELLADHCRSSSRFSCEALRRKRGMIETRKMLNVLAL